MVNQRKHWYLKNPIFRAIGVLTLIALCYVPLAYATTEEQVVKKEGSATTNELISINTTVQQTVEEKQKTQQDKFRIDVKGLKTERNDLAEQKQALEQQVKQLEEELKKKEQELVRHQKEVKSKKTSNKVSQATPTSKASTPKNKESKKATISAVATAYTAHCAGCSGTTANGTNLRANPNAKVIAVDPKVIPLNSKVEVIHQGKSLGVYTAGDTGGAIKGHKIDIFMSNKDKAIDWGVQNVTLNVLK